MKLETELMIERRGNSFRCTINYELEPYFSSMDPDAEPSYYEPGIEKITVPVESDFNGPVDIVIWEWDRYHKGGIPSALWTHLRQQAVDAVNDEIERNQNLGSDC